MIGTFSLGVLGPVAVDALGPQRTEMKPVGGGVGVTPETVGHDMGARERETATTMKADDVGNDPRRRCVASAAFISQGAVVDIGMAFAAFHGCFRELQ